MCLYTHIPFRPKQVDLNRKFVFKHSQREWTGVPIMAANMYVCIHVFLSWPAFPLVPRFMALHPFDRVLVPSPLSPKRSTRSLPNNRPKCPPKRDTVGTFTMAEELAKSGIVTCVHKHYSTEEV